MDDFSPAAVARKVDALNKLLTRAPSWPTCSPTWIGKDKAEELIGKLLQDPELLKSLAPRSPEAERAPDPDDNQETRRKLCQIPQSKPQARRRQRPPK